MLIRWTKLTDERHRVELVRDDGTREERELETRSFLVHDFAHYAVEAQMGLADGVYGHLARGLGFDELPPMTSSTGLARAERLAAPFQSLWHGRLERALYLGHAGVDDAFVDGAMERMRTLMGHWKATPFRSSMERRWPP